jgi:hypothetical protein
VHGVHQASSPEPPSSKMPFRDEENLEAVSSKSKTLSPV